MDGISEGGGGRGQQGDDCFHELHLQDLHLVKWVMIYLYNCLWFKRIKG